MTICADLECGETHVGLGQIALGHLFGGVWKRVIELVGMFAVGDDDI